MPLLRAPSRGIPRQTLMEHNGVPRPHRISVSLTTEELKELQAMADRDRTSVSAVLRVAARDAAGMPAPPKPKPAGWDDGYDHALQQELSLLNLIATEQAIKLLEAISPYGQTAPDELVVAAAQAAQRRIARGIPDALGGRTDGER
jgi:hypothetical protein